MFLGDFLLFWWASAILMVVFVPPQRLKALVEKSSQCFLFAHLYNSLSGSRTTKEKSCLQNVLKSGGTCVKKQPITFGWQFGVFSLYAVWHWPCWRIALFKYFLWQLCCFCLDESQPCTISTLNNILIRQFMPHIFFQTTSEKELSR